MSAKQYMSQIGQATGAHVAAAQAERAVNVLGVGDSSLSRFLQKAKEEAPPDVEDGITTIIGAAAGAWYGHKRGHILLGAIAGGSLGRNLPALFDDTQRNIALCNLGGTAAAIALALTRETNTGRAAVFVATEIAASLVCTYGKLR